jgi:hypothetical protein
MKQNCWDFKKCGREPGGQHMDDLGPCPVATYTDLNGLHGGKNAGRACWVVTGSLCGGKVQGNEEQKRKACWECDFLKLVKKEEEPTSVGFSHTRLGMDRVIKKMGGR